MTSFSSIHKVEGSRLQLSSCVKSVMKTVQCTMTKLSGGHYEVETSLFSFPKQNGDIIQINMVISISRSILCRSSLLVKTYLPSLVMLYASRKSVILHSEILFV